MPKMTYVQIKLLIILYLLFYLLFYFYYIIFIIIVIIKILLNNVNMHHKKGTIKINILKSIYTFSCISIYSDIFLYFNIYLFIYSPPKYYFLTNFIAFVYVLTYFCI